MSWSVHFVPKRPDQDWDDAHAFYDEVCEDDAAAGPEALAAGRVRQQALASLLQRTFPTFEGDPTAPVVVLTDARSGIEVWIEPFGLSLAAPHGDPTEEPRRVQLLSRIADLVVASSDLRCEELEETGETTPPPSTPPPAPPPSPSPATSSPRVRNVRGAVLPGIATLCVAGLGASFAVDPYVPADARVPNEMLRPLFDLAWQTGGSAAVAGAVLALAALTAVGTWMTFAGIDAD